MSARKTKQPVAVLVSVGMDELYTEWFQCPKCEFKDIARHFTFCPSCGIQVRAGAAAADSENAAHERGNAFAAAPCYVPLVELPDAPNRECSGVGGVRKRRKARTANKRLQQKPLTIKCKP